MSHPTIENAGEVLALEQQSRDSRDSNLWRAVMLAKDFETCRALLLGERVPASRLDRVWLARFGVSRGRRAA